MARVLVTGGYGLIGAEVTRALIAAGHAVTVLGRDGAMAARVLPGLPFVARDMARMCAPADWAALLGSADAVVNCAGALQDGPADDLEALHHSALAALGQAAAGAGVRVVQISAAGVAEDAATVFMASKARGDAALLASGARAVILRPGLVLARTSYGGTALLRMLAAVPLVQPLMLAQAPVQTVDVADVAQAVVLAVAGQVPEGQALDLVEDTPHPLAEVVAAQRHALGFAPARVRLVLPRLMLRPVGWLGDTLARMGWRSPLRRTALAVTKGGVTGDPGPWAALHGPLRPLEATLAGMGYGVEHRLQARAALLMPLAVAVLALFWAASGLIGLIRLPAAAAVLQGVGWPFWASALAVAFWALVDLALAAAILWRPFAARACWAMLAVSAVYLVSASVLTPALWLDPLGPLVKVLPGMALAVVTRVLLEAR